MSMDGRYYAKGDRVYRAPLQKKNADGTTSTTMGFVACECIDDEMAEEIAMAMNVNLALQQAEQAEEV